MTRVALVVEDDDIIDQFVAEAMIEMYVINMDQVHKLEDIPTEELADYQREDLQDARTNAWAANYIYKYFTGNYIK